MYLFENILPNDIVMKIYQYDPTYHEQRKTVFVEMEKKLKFWRIKWLNREFDYGEMDTQKQYNISDFQNSIKNIKYICDYWNFVYPQHYSAQRKNNHTIKGSNNCEFEYINDSIKANKHIFGRLKMLKKYTINDKNQLYKPGKFYQTSPF
jgi:hypothetical protein